jgi:hypothetical protein
MLDRVLDERLQQERRHTDCADRLRHVDRHGKPIAEPYLLNFTTLNIAVFAPMPMASDATITRVEPALRLKVRSA